MQSQRAALRAFEIVQIPDRLDTALDLWHIAGAMCACMPALIVAVLPEGIAAHLVIQASAYHVPVVRAVMTKRHGGWHWCGKWVKASYSPGGNIVWKAWTPDRGI